VLVLISSLVIASYKWKMLAQFKGLDFSLRHFFNLYLAGTLINNFMPSFVAGEAYKAYEIAKPQKKYFEATSTVIMDRLTGLAAAMILALVFSVMNYKVLFRNNFLMTVDVLIIISLLIDIAIAQLKKISLLRRWVMKILPDQAVRFLQHIYNYSNNTSIIKKAVLWSILYSFIGVAFLNYILFWALGISVGFVNYMSVIFLISIISSLPITIDSIGLKEWAYIALFGLFGVGSGAALAVSVISRFLQILVSLGALPFYLKNKK
jgi:uncharacterized protein (TIRG00374 family)